MAETPSTSSTQNSIVLVLNSKQPGGTLVHIESETGEEILTFEPLKDYQLFVFSSPELQVNTTFNVYIDGDVTGMSTDGLYSEGTYTAGNQIASLEITSSVTTSGSFDQGFGGGRKGGGCHKCCTIQI